MHEMNKDQKKIMFYGSCEQNLMQKITRSNVTSFDPTKNTTPMLSVCYSQLQLGVPGTVLASIWNKSSQYLATDNAVVQAPSVECGVRSFSVHSRSSSRPNSVTLSEDGKMTCTCLMFKSNPNVCSHTVVTTEDANVLSTYLEW